MVTAGAASSLAPGQVSGSEVGELRTLKEIADHLSSLVPSDLHDSPIIPAPISDSSVPVKKKS